MACSADYAELHCVSNHSFLRGASHPEELVERAKALGYAALAVTDECSVGGLVRAHLAADGLGRAPAEVALSWLLERDQLASAIVGARTPAQLRTSLGATDLSLPAEVLSALDDVSAPAIGYPERW
jgi:diketogulonate reductase-like aldo/keto reductase